MRGCVVCLVAVAIATVTGAQDEDAIRSKLDRAKETYQADLEKAKLAFDDWHEKQTEVARKAGKKERVDQLKAERGTFESSGLLPHGVTPSVRSKFASARAGLNSAYSIAVKEYTKAKMDAEAAKVQKEWLTFKADPTGDPDVIVLLNRSAQKYLIVGVPKGKEECRAVLGNESYNDRTHLWRLVPATGGWFTIQTLDGTGYLGTEASRTDKEARLVIGPLREAKVATTQHWQFVPTDSGYGKLVHRASGKIVHSQGKSKETGASAVIWPDEKAAPHAEWHIR